MCRRLYLVLQNFAFRSALKYFNKQFIILRCKLVHFCASPLLHEENASAAHFSRDLSTFIVTVYTQQIKSKKSFFVSFFCTLFLYLPVSCDAAHALASNLHTDYIGISTRGVLFAFYLPKLSFYWNSRKKIDFFIVCIFIYLTTVNFW